MEDESLNDIRCEQCGLALGDLADDFDFFCEGCGEHYCDNCKQDMDDMAIIDNKMKTDGSSDSDSDFDISDSDDEEWHCYECRKMIREEKQEEKIASRERNTKHMALLPAKDNVQQTCNK